MNSNRRDWEVFMKDLRELVKSAQKNLPLDGLIPEEGIYQEMLNVLSKFDITAWIMFDTEKNRDLTKEILHQLWTQIGKGKFLGETFLGPLFESYYCLYQVNHVSETYYIVQNLVKKSHGLYLNKSNLADFQEGDIFFGRIIEGEDGYFLFQWIETIVEGDRDNFLTHFNSLLDRYSISPNSSDDLEEDLAKGNPELVFMYSLAKKITFGQEDPYFLSDDLEDSWVGFDLDLKDLDPFMQFAHINSELEDSLRLILQLSLIRDRFEEVKGGKIDWTNGDEILGFASMEGLLASDKDLKNIITLLEMWIRKESKDGERKSLNFKDNIILYKNKLAQSYKGFYSDPYFEPWVKKQIESEEENFWFFDGFERFIEHIMIKEIHLTPTGRFRYEDLDEIVHLCQLSSIRNAKRPDERHYPMLGLWKNFAKIKGILEVDRSSLQVSEVYEFYQSMDLDEKISLWLTSLVKTNFLTALYEEGEFLIFSNGREFLDGWKELLILGWENKLDTRELRGERTKFFFELIYSLKLIHSTEGRIFSLTSLGEAVANYLNLKDGNQEKGLISFPN